MALAVDLVAEYDGDESYPDAVLAVARSTTKPVVVLSNLGSAIDEATATRIRAAGVPVLEGTRSGLLALHHLLERERLLEPTRNGVAAAGRRSRWTRPDDSAGWNAWAAGAPWPPPRPSPSWPTTAFPSSGPAPSTRRPRRWPPPAPSATRW